MKTNRFEPLEMLRSAVGCRIWDGRLCRILVAYSYPRAHSYSECVLLRAGTGLQVLDELQSIGLRGLEDVLAPMLAF